MKSYDVYTEVLFVHTIEVDDDSDADYAAQVVEQGEGGRGECMGATVTKVVKTGDDGGDDLRTPVICSKCGRDGLPGSGDPCIWCWLEARRAAS